jgi:hypothetical protein
VTSQKQAAANRSNAKHNSGPKTERGKARSRLNAVKHGLTAREIVIGDEDPQEFEALRSGLNAYFRSVGPMEEALVDRIAGLTWRRWLIPRMEAAIIRRELESAEERERDKLYDEVFDSEEMTSEEQERSDRMTEVLNEPITDDDDEALARLKEITRPDSREVARQISIDRARSQASSRLIRWWRPCRAMTLPL